MFGKRMSTASKAVIWGVYSLSIFEGFNLMGKHQELYRDFAHTNPRKYSSQIRREYLSDPTGDACARSLLGVLSFGSLATIVGTGGADDRKKED